MYNPVSPFDGNRSLYTSEQYWLDCVRGQSFCNYPSILLGKLRLVATVCIVDGILCGTKRCVKKHCSNDSDRTFDDANFFSIRHDVI